MARRGMDGQVKAGRDRGSAVKARPGVASFGRARLGRHGNAGRSDASCGMARRDVAGLAPPGDARLVGAVMVRLGVARPRTACRGHVWLGAAGTARSGNAQGEASCVAAGEASRGLACLFEAGRCGARRGLAGEEKQCPQS
jgi:hypothetical protein